MYSMRRNLLAVLSSDRGLSEQIRDSLRQFVVDNHLVHFEHCKELLRPIYRRWLERLLENRSETIPPRKFAEACNRLTKQTLNDLFDKGSISRIEGRDYEWINVPAIYNGKLVRRTSGSSLDELEHLAKSYPREYDEKSRVQRVEVVYCREETREILVGIRSDKAYNRSELYTSLLVVTSIYLAIKNLDCHKKTNWLVTPLPRSGREWEEQFVCNATLMIKDHSLNVMVPWAPDFPAAVEIEKFFVKLHERNSNATWVIGGPFFLKLGLPKEHAIGGVTSLAELLSEVRPRTSS